MVNLNAVQEFTTTKELKETYYRAILDACVVTITNMEYTYVQLNNPEICQAGYPGGDVPFKRKGWIFRIQTSYSVNGIVKI